MLEKRSNPKDFCRLPSFKSTSPDHCKHTDSPRPATKSHPSPFNHQLLSGLLLWAVSRIFIYSFQVLAIKLFNGTWISDLLEERQQIVANIDVLIERLEGSCEHTASDPAVLLTSIRKQLTSFIRALYRHKCTAAGNVYICDDDKYWTAADKAICTANSATSIFLYRWKYHARFGSEHYEDHDS